MSWLGAATPTPSQTQGTETAPWAGGAILLVILAVVALTFALAWFGKYRGRRRPAEPDPEKPFRPT